MSEVKRSKLVEQWLIQQVIDTLKIEGAVVISYVQNSLLSINSATHSSEINYLRSSGRLSD